MISMPTSRGEPGEAQGYATHFLRVLDPRRRVSRLDSLLFFHGLCTLGGWCSRLCLDLCRTHNSFQNLHLLLAQCATPSAIVVIFKVQTWLFNSNL